MIRRRIRNIAATGRAGVATGGPYPFGMAASFNASGDKIVVADHASLSPTAAMSLVLWVKQTTGAGSEYELAGKFSAGSNNGWFLRTNIDQVVWGIKEAASATGSGATPASSFSENVWTHVAAVYDSTGGTNATRMKIYLNGVNQTLTFTNTVPSPMEDNAADLEFGEATGIGSAFLGQLDEIGFYNVALTAAEVAQDYARNRPSRGLVSWWTFNNSTANDYVGGRNGTATSIDYVAH